MVTLQLAKLEPCGRPRAGRQQGVPEDLKIGRNEEARGNPQAFWQNKFWVLKQKTLSGELSLQGRMMLKQDGSAVVILFRASDSGGAQHRPRFNSVANQRKVPQTISRMDTNSE